jgi:ABC-type Na+ efflux pump permease subunit
MYHTNYVLVVIFPAFAGILIFRVKSHHLCLFAEYALINPMMYFSFVFAGKSGIPLEANLNASSGATAAANTGFSFSVEPQAALLLLAVSLFLVLMFSAIILSISIFAKSFKEAESYISPAYIIVILPVVFVNAVPGFEPALAHFAVPAVNAILLFKEILMGTYNWAHIALTLGSLAVYSAVAVFIASKIYSKESVLFND